MGAGWHSEAAGRVAVDCLQMLFWGALCLFNERMWNINLPSPRLQVTDEAVWVQLPLHWPRRDLLEL